MKDLSIDQESKLSVFNSVFADLEHVSGNPAGISTYLSEKYAITIDSTEADSLSCIQPKGNASFTLFFDRAVRVSEAELNLYNQGVTVGIINV